MENLDNLITDAAKTMRDATVARVESTSGEDVEQFRAIEDAAQAQLFALIDKRKSSAYPD